MRKLTVFIEGDSTEVLLDESILITHENPYILVMTATVYWNYNNVFSGFNNVVKYRPDARGLQLQWEV